MLLQLINKMKDTAQTIKIVQKYKITICIIGKMIFIVHLMKFVCIRIIYIMNIKKHINVNNYLIAIQVKYINIG